jgi:hypothetical protein
MFDLDAIKASGMADVYASIMAFVNDHFQNLPNPEDFLEPGIKYDVESDEEMIFWACSDQSGFSWSYYSQYLKPERAEHCTPVIIGIGICVSGGDDHFEPEIRVAIFGGACNEILNQSVWNSVMDEIKKLSPEFENTGKEVDSDVDDNDSIQVGGTHKRSTRTVHFSEKIFVRVFSFKDDVIELTDCTDVLKPDSDQNTGNTQVEQTEDPSAGNALADQADNEDRPVKRQKV